MRSYASDTALPGGKYEEGDLDEEGTARREAYEEVGYFHWNEIYCS